MRILLAAAALLAFVTPASANELKLSFNADAFRIEFDRPFTGSALQWGVGWLGNSDEGNVIHGNFSLTGKMAGGQSALTGGVGLRIAYTNGELSNQDGVGVAVGGFFRYAFPAVDRLFVAGHAYFAPSVLSVGELDQYQDFEARIGYNILREADLYLGLRYVEGQYDKQRRAKFDSGLMLGVALRF